MDPPDWKIYWLYFWCQDQKLWNALPQNWHLLETFEILLLYVLSNDACKFAINLFPISWGPFENVNFLYFLLKMQVWNSCNAVNVAGNPIKDINVNLTFSVQDQMLWNGCPPDLKFFWLYFWGQDQSSYVKCETLFNNNTRNWECPNFWIFAFF